MQTKQEAPWGQGGDVRNKTAPSGVPPFQSVKWHGTREVSYLTAPQWGQILWIFMHFLHLHLCIAILKAVQKTKNFKNDYFVQSVSFGILGLRFI